MNDGSIVDTRRDGIKGCPAATTRAASRSSRPDRKPWEDGSNQGLGAFSFDARQPLLLRNFKMNGMAAGGHDELHLLLMLRWFLCRFSRGLRTNPAKATPGVGRDLRSRWGSAANLLQNHGNKEGAGTAARSTAAVPTQDRRERELTPAPP